MVIGTLWGSVVAKMNFTWGGGSSNVLRSALKALVESMCTSSMMNILYRRRDGRYLTVSFRSRMSSTLVLDAPSISKTSTELPAVISSQALQALHGSGAGPFSQFRAFASILAALVFPTPLPPVNRKAWATLPESMAFFRVWLTCSWPIRSRKVWGRHLRAKTRYD